jgi:hypothetical protein
LDGERGAKLENFARSPYILEVINMKHKWGVLTADIEGMVATIIS